MSIKLKSLEEVLAERVVIKEEIENINGTGIGGLISYTMGFIGQVHIWHLLCPSGQKHTALGELYAELESEVDGLAEKFIAQGGTIQSIEFNLLAKYSDVEVVQKLQAYRDMISSTINISDTPEMKSILDGAVDLQEVVDNKLYKFTLN